MRGVPAVGLGAAAAVLALAVCAGPAGADSFTPIRMTIAIAPVARLDAPLAVRVTVDADPDVLDNREGPMRVELKLAGECGGDFQHTPGVTLLNKPLSPGPVLGKAYHGSVGASGSPVAYGVQTVCAYLEDADIGRVYANDESTTVNVSAVCTSAGRRYDAAATALTRARRQYRRARTPAARRRARGLVARRRRTLTVARRSGAAACGPGVPL